MSIDADKIEHIQKKFAGLCFNRFLSQFPYIHAFTLEVFKFLFDRSDTLLCSLSALIVKCLLLPDALQLLMLYGVKLMYLDPNLFLLITFCNLLFLIINCTQYQFMCICVYAYISSHCIMDGMIESIK
jgi:hypothetical protein